MKFPQLATELPMSHEQYDNLSTTEKKQLLERENRRIINEIKESSEKRGKSIEWIRLIRNIREY